mmetsp:Transcript_94332/g.177515  ORF Transcript_94332/g.177515 Transcript_94332/m.177515 type:complete len:214 (-) Transcript_94332:136-777(-)
MTGIKGIGTLLTFTAVCGNCESGDYSCLLQAPDTPGGLKHHSLLQHSAVHAGHEASVALQPKSDHLPQDKPAFNAFHNNGTSLLHAMSEVAHEHLSSKEGKSLADVIDKAHSRRLQTGVADLGSFILGMFACLAIILIILMGYFFTHGGTKQEFIEHPGMSLQRAENQMAGKAGMMYPSERRDRAMPQMFAPQQGGQWDNYQSPRAPNRGGCC